MRATKCAQINAPNTCVVANARNQTRANTSKSAHASHFARASARMQTNARKRATRKRVTCKQMCASVRAYKQMRTRVRARASKCAQARGKHVCGNKWGQHVCNHLITNSAPTIYKQSCILRDKLLYKLNWAPIICKQSTLDHNAKP